MTPLLIYFLKVNLTLGILFLAYYFLLRREKFFQLNRIILLSSIGLAFLLPLLPAVERSAESRLEHRLSDLNPFSSVRLVEKDTLIVTTSHTQTAAANPKPTTSSATIPRVLQSLYILIVAVLIGRLLFQLFRVYGIIKKSRREKIAGIICCNHGLELPPFSFFRWLVLNKDLYPSTEVDQIIAHEQAHIRQGHSFDLLLTELLHALCWINPLLIGFKRAVRLNLEYIADEEALSTGVDVKAYQYSILRHLQYRGMPLVNEFTSSKIKLRIHMINKQSSPLRNLYKYALALPLLTGAYLLVNPPKVHAAPPANNPIGQAAKDQPANNQSAGALSTSQDLKALEGYYQSTDNKDSYIRISVKNDRLVLTQMWDDHEIPFDQSSPLEFATMEGRFPLKFSKDANGAITEVLAMNRDRWIKVKSYTPISYTTLTPAQLESFAGYYEADTKLKGYVYLQIEATPDGLLLRQGWDGLEFPFRPTSATSFFNKGASFAIEFTKDNKGSVTEMLALHKDHWKKMSDPSKAVIKTAIKLNDAQLKKLEGEYHSAEGGNTLHMDGKDGRLVLTQGWDGRKLDIYPSSPTEFFSKENHFPVIFTVDKDGNATEILIIDRDRWIKSK